MCVSSHHLIKRQLSLEMNLFQLKHNKHPTTIGCIHFSYEQNSAKRERRAKISIVSLEVFVGLLCTDLLTIYECM